MEQAANRHVHPIFGNALAAFTAPSLVVDLQQTAYAKALKAHDWDFEFSDDHSVYTSGRDALAQLRMVQREIDADGTLWNQHAPAGHGISMAVSQ